jgi:D-threo-aldose 1-dehydrogenase
LEVSVVGFGGAPLGDLYGKLGEGDAVNAVVSAVSSGISYFDTAPLYGHGLSEHRIGAALRRVDSADEIVLSTKVGRVTIPFASRGEGSGYVGGAPHGIRYDYGYDGTMRSLEQSLLRLGRSRIEIVYIHDVDRWTHGVEAPQRYAEAMAGAVKALEKLRDEKVISGYGVGVNEADTAERFARDCDPDVILLAGRYSLLEQPALESFMPFVAERGIGVVLGGVFNSGILATGAVPGARYNYKPAPAHILAKVTQLEDVCAAHGVPLRRAALHFALGHPAVSSLVLGAVSPAEVSAQLKAFVDPVPKQLWADLKSRGLLRNDVPTPE